MKRYGVIVYSKYKCAWGIYLLQKTAKCPQCSKIYNVAQRKIFHHTLDLRDLQTSIATLQEKLLK